MMKIIFYLVLVTALLGQGFNFLKYSSNANNLSAANNGYQPSLGSALSSNPSELSFFNYKYALHGSYTSFSGDIKPNSFVLGGSYSLSSAHNFGLSFKYFKIDQQVLQTILTSYKLPVENNFEWSLKLDYGYRLNKNLGLGASIGFLHSEIVPFNFVYNGETVRTVNTIALNLGGTYQLSQRNRTKLGFSLNNIGAGYHYVADGETYKQPTFWQLSFGSKVLEISGSDLFASAEFKKATEEGSLFGLHLGYEILKSLDLNLGYVIDNKFLRDDSYLSLGISFNMDRVMAAFGMQSYSSDKDATYISDQQLSFTMEYYGERNPDIYADMDDEPEEKIDERAEDEPFVMKEEPKKEEVVTKEERKETTGKVAEKKKPEEKIEKKEEKKVEEPVILPKKRYSAVYENLVREAEAKNENDGTLLSNYRVKKGDNLWDLAVRYLDDGYKYKDIFLKNVGRINDEDLIEVDQEIIIIKKSPNSDIKIVFYHAKNGESLASIAEKLFNDSSRWTEIYNWNNSVTEENPDKTLSEILLKIELD